MDIAYVLFSPKGRIGRRDFLRGIILLTGVSIIVQVGATFALPPLVLAQYVLIWSYACVFGKRLHDAGYSAWLYLAFLAGFVVLQVIVSNLLMPLLSPEVLPVQAELEAIGMTGDFAGMVQAMSERAPEIARLSALTSLAALLVTSAALALAGAQLKSDPHPNAHGPATGPGTSS
ncbi:MAG: DUF805 domain-containing protein [Hyphomonas sp.]|nr:DUF805 domain-containing protein [Hyphomonas sp.]